MSILQLLVSKEPVKSLGEFSNALSSEAISYIRLLISNLSFDFTPSFESGTEERGHRAKTPSSEIKAANTLSTPEGSFSMPLRIRGRLTQEIGELAGASNGVIRGGESPDEVDKNV